MQPKSIYLDARDWERLKKLSNKTKIPLAHFIREGVQRVARAYRAILDAEDFKMEIDPACPLVLDACERKEEMNAKAKVAAETKPETT